MLDFVQLEFFVYGFILVIWTHSLWFPLAIISILWFGMSWTAVHRKDDDKEQFEFHVYTFLEIIFGIWTGFWFLWALKTPKWWDIRIIRPNNFKITAVTTLIIIGTIFINLGYLYVNGNFEGVSKDVAKGVGIALIVIGAILFIGTLIYAWVSFANVGYGRLTVKYFLPLAVLISTPAIYDFLALAGFDKWHGAVLLAALVVIYFLMYFYIVKVKVKVKIGKDLKMAYYNDDDDEKKVVIFLSFSFVIHFVTMLAGWLVDINTGSRVIPLVITIGSLTAFWTIFLIFIALVFFPERRESSRQSNRFAMKTNKYQNKSKSKSKKKNQKKIYTDLF